ncbi:MAG: glycosyltransferase [Vicinamibacterales bacterium]
MIPLTEHWPVLSGHADVRTSEIRVCHFMTADLWAGAEVQLRTVASYLVERPEIRLSAVLLNEGRLASELKAMGIPVAVVDEHLHGAAAIVAFLVRFLRTHEIDILHTHRYKDTVLGTVAAKLAGVSKVVRTVHGLPEPLRGWERMRFRAYGALETMALRTFADRVIAVSEDLAQSLRTAGHRRSAVMAIHNGIDLSQVRSTRDAGDVRRELGLPADAVGFGTLGRLSAVKGQASLLRAAQRVLRQEPNARFLLVGDGPLYHDLVTTAIRLGIDHACVFAGARHDTPDLLAAMDVFVLPSLHEGIPMALLEAMALGKPVVATAVGGVPEIVSHRANGLLVAGRDDRALADSCLELARTPGLRVALGSAARRTIAENFSHEIGGQALVDAYLSLVDADGPDARVDARNVSSPRLAWELTRGLFRITGRRASRLIEYRRARRDMHQVRRNASRLRKALQSARTILVMCHGNIIRSPFAAALLTRAAAGSGIQIHSAGLGAVEGNPSHPIAIRIAAARDVDLTRHAASPVGAESIAESDVIFVMDISQLITMQRRFPEARHKTFLLTCLASDTPLEVRDPVDGDEPIFQACFDHISNAVRPIADTLRAGAIVQ